MNIIKKQSIGTWISLVTIILSVIALIIYGAALSSGMDLVIASGSQPFYEADRAEDQMMMSMVVTCGVIALVFLVAAILLGQFKPEGIIGKVCGVLADALRIVAPALIMAVTLYFLYGSFTGLGWTFFSNEELEIYPEAVSTGKLVITGLVFFILAAIASVVSAFFGITKKKSVAD